MLNSPPNCRPECLVASECSTTLTCINKQCKDPCQGSCGTSTECHVLSHTPICSCLPGMTGDPFSGCVPYETTSRPLNADPCDGKCGQNAECRNGQCVCILDYQGNPYEYCRPECVMNVDCPRNKACVKKHCVDPCVGICGENAICDAVNHMAICTCADRTEGNPLVRCTPVQKDTGIVIREPCNPSPCGPYSQCRAHNSQPICSCIQGYTGAPPQCRPECLVSSDCSLILSCINNKCVDPCPGACGINARCEVRNHSPICTCNADMTGEKELYELNTKNP
jgi:hypothetical protein